MNLRTRARLYAVAALGVLIWAAHKAIYSVRHTMGKDDFLATQSRMFDRLYTQPHTGRALAGSLMVACLVIGLYELIAAGLLAMMQSGREKKPAPPAPGGGA